MAVQYTTEFVDSCEKGPADSGEGTAQTSVKELVDTRVLEKRTGVAAATWNNRRVTGDTPPFLKIGARVLYRWADVEAWLDTKVRHSTSET